MVAAALLATAGWFEGPAHAKTGGGYRLAGVVAVGNDYLAFLELPDGGQMLVRKGTSIDGGGRVAELNSEKLRITFPDRTIELTLTESGIARPPATQGILQGQSDQGHIMVREVDSVALQKSLSAPTQGIKRADASGEVGRRFASLINLPINARVLAVNEVPVTSAEKAIRLAENTLANGMPVRLNLAAASGDPETRVYLLPARN